MGKLFIVSGPSGVGKTTLVKAIITRLYPTYPIERIVTYTSKKMRLGEKEAQDYYFISHSEFEGKITQGFFLEWSTAYNAYYGSPRSILGDLSRGKSCILIIDRIGAQKIVAHVKDPVLIWLTVSCLDILRDRLYMRGTENDEKIARRLERAKIEIEDEQNKPFYKYYVCNDDFKKAVVMLEEIIRQELPARCF